MSDGIHCGPFNVSGGLGLHPRSGASEFPTTDPRLGTVFAQVDGHLGYVHPSGTAYTLTPPGTGGVPTSGVDGLWKQSDAGTQHIQPINAAYGAEVNSGTEIQPGLKVGLGGQHGMYSEVAPIPLSHLTVVYEGQKQMIFADLGAGADAQIHIPKHDYGPTKPRIAGEGTSGTGMYFPSNSGIGLSSEGELGIEIQRLGVSMQARFPAGTDVQPGISFADHPHAGLQMPDLGPDSDEAGKIAMLISDTLQTWSGTQIVNERNTLINGNLNVQANGNLGVDTGSAFISGTLIVNANAFFNNDVYIAGNLDPKSVRYVPQGDNPATQNQDDYVYSRIPDGNRLYHGTSGIAYLHETTSGVVIKSGGSLVGPFNTINFSGASVSNQAGEALVVVGSGGGSAELPAEPATNISEISSVPRWFKFDVIHTDINDQAVLKREINLADLPIKGWIDGIHWKPRTWIAAPIGGDAPVLKMSIGSGGHATRWLSGVELWSDAKGSSTSAENAIGLTPWEPDFDNTHKLIATFEASDFGGDDLTDVTSGITTVWFRLSNMNNGDAEG
jgi:hypothetical protein